MPDMNIKFKIAIVLLPVILMTGCGRKSSPATVHDTESTAAEPLAGQSGVSAPAPAKMKPGQTTVPITGALGWTLGGKRPVGMPESSPDTAPAGIARLVMAWRAPLAENFPGARYDSSPNQHPVPANKDDGREKIRR